MKKFKILFAFALVAIATTVTLSSFSGKAEAKQTVAIEKKADAKPFDAVTLYFVSGTTWSTQTQGSDCNASGQFCRLTYNDDGVSKTPAQIAALAQAAYAPTLSNAPISGTVNVDNGNGGQVTVTIFEKAGQ